MKRVAVGITGATGVVYGVRFLEALRDLKIESHLILSDAAKKSLLIETPYSVDEVEKLAHSVYRNNELTAW